MNVETSVLAKSISAIVREALAKLRAEIDVRFSALQTYVDLKYASVSVIKGEKGDKGDQGERGFDGSVGKAGIDGADGRDGVNGTNGRDGVDGKTGEKGVDGKDGAAGIDGKAGRDGIDGKMGATGERGAQGERGVDGRDGRDGANGRDATEIDPLDDFDEQKDYPAGMWARHNGGLWRSQGGTRWKCIVDGFCEAKRERMTDRRFVKTILVFSSGRTFEFLEHSEEMMYAGIFRDGERYSKGDVVTYSGSMWHCNVNDTQSAPKTNNDWTLVVKEGRAGKDAGAVPARDNGKPVRLI